MAVDSGASLMDSRAPQSVSAAARGEGEPFGGPARPGLYRLLAAASRFP